MLKINKIFVIVLFCLLISLPIACKSNNKSRKYENLGSFVYIKYTKDTKTQFQQYKNGRNKKLFEIGGYSSDYFVRHKNIYYVNNETLCAYNLLSKKTKKINGVKHVLDISSNGNFALIYSTSLKGTLLVDLGTGKMTQISKKANGAAISKDNKLVAYSVGSRVFVYSIANKKIIKTNNYEGAFQEIIEVNAWLGIDKVIVSVPTDIAFMERHSLFLLELNSLIIDQIDFKNDVFPVATDKFVYFGQSEQADFTGYSLLRYDFDNKQTIISKFGDVSPVSILNNRLLFRAQGKKGDWTIYSTNLNFEKVHDYSILNADMPQWVDN